MIEEAPSFKKVLIYTLVCVLGSFICSKTYRNLTDYITIHRLDKNIENIRLSHSITEKKHIDSFKSSRLITNGIIHRKYIRWLNNKPIVINIVNVSPMEKNFNIKASYGDYKINKAKTVRDIAGIENAIIAINGSYFNEKNEIPIGASVIDNETVTGPLYNRVSFGVTQDNKFKIDKIKLYGNIFIGEKKLQFFNINQQVFSKIGFTIFNAHWGNFTPKTSSAYSHIVVNENKIIYVKNSSVEIPKNGFVLVGLNKNLPKPLLKGTFVKYNTVIYPLSWKNIRYAVSGGPYLIQDGRIFIDKQKFSKDFLWTKDSRTAIGYTKEGTLILLTVDAIRKGVSEGATIYELAKIMWEIGAYQSINLDGGKSTQMVINGRIVNYPQVAYGNKVINALIIGTPSVSPITLNSTVTMQKPMENFNKILKNSLTVK